MDASFSHQSTLFSPSSTFRPNLMRKELLFSAVSNKAEQETARNPNSFTQVRATCSLQSTMHDALTICVQVRVTDSEFDLAYRYANVWRMLTLADRVPKPYLFAVTRSARGAQASEEAGRHDRSDGQFFIEWRDLQSDTSPSSPSSSAAAGIPWSRTYTPSLPPSLPQTFSSCIQLQQAWCCWRTSRTSLCRKSMSWSVCSQSPPGDTVAMT